jgi:DNA invertase Pin-like site-specific DNA recombinase
MLKSIAIRRVSSKKQEENNHSLDQQDTSVQNMAAVLESEIVKEWAMATSAKKGKNLKREDLQQALNYCRYNRGVKYLLIDKVSRFARELKIIFYYIVEFEKLDVKVVFCDPNQQKFNADTAEAMYELARKAYDAEAENEERSQTSFTKMKARVALGYYPFYPHQGYQKTEAADGLHVPDPLRFYLLQKALKSTASLTMTPKEAQLWLAANGYRTPVIYRKDKDGHKLRRGERVLDLNHFVDIMKAPYYAGILKVNDWPINEHGLHKPMITTEEHGINLAIANGRKVRKKQKYNPDFPLNISWHEPCREKDGKLTGINHNNGKGWKRKEYLCRSCKKRVPQAKVHASMDHLLNHLVTREEGLTELKKALKQVWGNNEAYRLDRLVNHKERKGTLLAKKSEFLGSLAANPDLAEDFIEEINKIKAEITNIDVEMAKDGSIDEEFAEFADFALDYTEDLRKRWWQLPGEKLAECKQLLFRGEIIVQPSGNVYTPFLSYIYSLESENDDPKVAENQNMVELPVIATGSDC